MTIKTPLYRDSDAACWALIRLSCFASLWVEAVDRVNARSRQDVGGEVISDGGGWKGRTPRLGGPCEVAMLKCAFVKAAGASALEARGV